MTKINISVVIPEKSDYQLLIEDIGSILLHTKREGSRILFICYHDIGRSLYQYCKAQKLDTVHKASLLVDMAATHGKQVRTMQRCLQYSDDLKKQTGQVEEIHYDLYDEGEDINWSTIVNKYLPTPKEQKKRQADVQRETYINMLQEDFDAINKVVGLFQDPRIYRIMAFNAKEKEILRNGIKAIEKYYNGDK